MSCIHKVLSNHPINIKINYNDEGNLLHCLLWIPKVQWIHNTIFQWIWTCHSPIPFRMLHWTTRPLPPMSELTSSSLKLIPSISISSIPGMYRSPYVPSEGSPLIPCSMWEYRSSQKFPLTRQCFGTEFSRVLHIAGLETTNFSTHSFCIGAAT